MPPYLTIAMASRNDDYSNNHAAKRQFCLDVLLNQLDRYDIQAEIIFVDWNPPRDKPPLREILTINQEHTATTVRIFEVPPAIHQRYKHATVFHFNGAVAANTGLRRSRGDFVVYKCTDTIWSDSLMQHIATRRLDPSTLYRCVRKDVEPHPMELSSLALEEILAWCEGHTVQVHENSPSAFKELPNLFTNACGDFQLMSREAMRILRGNYEDVSAYVRYCDGYTSYLAYRMGIREAVLEDSCLYKLRHNLMHGSRITEKGGKSYVRGIEVPNNQEYISRLCEILYSTHGYIFNSIDWGLGRDDLKEHVLLQAEWDRP